MLNFSPEILRNHSEAQGWNPVSLVSDAMKAKIEEAVESGKSYLYPLPDRILVLEDGEKLCFVWAETTKHIDMANSWWDTRLTIARELAILINNNEWKILARDKWIKNLEQLLLILASQESKRKAMKKLSEEYSEIIELIEEWWISPEMEEKAKEFYDDFVAQVWVSQVMQNRIHALSWAWEKKYKHAQYICHSWVIIMCIMNMINFNKPQIK